MPLRLPPYSFFSRTLGDDVAGLTGAANGSDLSTVGTPTPPQALETPTSDVLAVSPSSLGGGVTPTSPVASDSVDPSAPTLVPTPSAEPSVSVTPLAMPFVSVDGSQPSSSSNDQTNGDKPHTFYGVIDAPQPQATPTPDVSLSMAGADTPASTFSDPTQVGSLTSSNNSVIEPSLSDSKNTSLPGVEPTASPLMVSAASAPVSSQTQTLGINGFGRIGRTAFRVWWQRFRDQTPLTVINTSGSSDLATWAHLLKYDSNYGVLPIEITVNEKRKKDQVTDADPELGTLTIDGHTVTVLAQRDPAKIPWTKYGVTSVIESTGKFVTQETASAHLQGGATKVVVSAPPKGEGEKGAMAMTVLGVQSKQPDAQIVSNASCTTNCVAPVAAIMQEVFGVEKAMLTTIHAYTDDQNLHDNSHKDLRRARSAAQNIVPTSTGAARAVGAIVPELAGKFDGLAVRVPVAVGSLSDMVFLTARPTTVEEVNTAFEKATTESRWQGILAVTKDPVVSHDIVGRSESSIVDLGLTQVVGGNLVKVVSWYDNEFGYCNRLVEVAVGVEA